MPKKCPDKHLETHNRIKNTIMSLIDQKKFLHDLGITYLGFPVFDRDTHLKVGDMDLLEHADTTSHPPLLLYSLYYKQDKDMYCNKHFASRFRLEEMLQGDTILRIRTYLRKNKLVI
jgi:hypothetical protein